MRKNRERNKVRKTAPQAIHKVNPPGTKNVLRWFKEKNEMHAETVEQAWAWYRGYYADKDAAVRRAEEKRRQDRAARSLQ